jgi:hypothetical protein
MKKTSLMLMIATVLSVVTINCNAQFLFLAKMGGEMAVKHVIKHNILHSSSHSSSEASSTKEAARTEKAAAKLKKANIKAAKNFSSQFKNQPNAEWFAEDNVITAYFKNDDIATRAVYDKKGNWLNTMLVYPESKMPNDVRQTVKKEYNSYEITQVQEIKEGDLTFYVVHLLDGNKYKEVTVCNGEMNVIKEYTQG